MALSIRFPVAGLSFLFVYVLASWPALAQGQDEEQDEEQDQILEEVVVTGSRAAPRSVFDSSSPADVISGEEFRSQGSTDLVDLVRTSIPSYNVNTQPISDASTVIRPANLRGLAADHTLVLVNNKRRHRAAVISWLGNGVSDGAQGPDISIIPSIALKQLEVLRDGASAQYGSDAIAGVMNFILRDDAEGISVEVKTGIYTAETDGFTWSIAGNAGLPVGEGFLNLSAEIGGSDETDRSVQRGDAQDLIEAGNSAVNDPAQIWGSPEVKGNVKTFFNFGLPVNEDVELYAFGNYAQRETDGGFFFRNPNTRSGVFATEVMAAAGTTQIVRLVGDETSDGTGNCPTPAVVPSAPDPSALAFVDDADAYQAALDQYATDLAANQVAFARTLEALRSNDDCFSFNEWFPGGFTPRFGADTVDYSLVAGVRGTVQGLIWDLSAGIGYNDADFFIYNTVNASLGSASPTEFDPGAYTQSETNVNLDLSYPITVPGLHSDLNIAAGLEWRQESFEITQGQDESFAIGPLARRGFSAASNGFSGFSELAAGSWDRENIAVYLDVEADVQENWRLGLAVRWEDFDGFGTTLNGKISTYYEVDEYIAVRSTYSTGFRAPTPGQSNAFNVTTEFDLTANELINNGTIPATSRVAELRGGGPLEPEESRNFTIGLVFSYAPFHLTMDLFRIKMINRIAPSQNFNLTEAEVTQLLAEGVTSAGNLESFRFFTNDFDTTTKGFDIVGTYSLDLFQGITDISFAWNRTLTQVDDFTPGILSFDRVLQLREGLPATRINLGVRHVRGPLTVQLRHNYYHDWYDSNDENKYSGYALTDLEFGYVFDFGLDLRVGIDNLLDKTPAESPVATSLGNRYSEYSPGGFNGRFLYARLTYDI